MEQSNCLPCRGKIAIYVSAALGLLGFVLAWYYRLYSISVSTISEQLMMLVALPWIIYVLFFYQKRKRAVLPAILFFCIAFIEVISFFCLLKYVRYPGWFYSLVPFKSFCFFVLYLLVAIDVLRGIRWRVFDLVVFSLNLLWIVAIVPIRLSWGVSAYICAFFLYVSFLIFFAANRVRPVIHAGKKATIAQLSPEKALTLLQEERDQNWISEEEFQQLRREVLEKLM